MAGYKRIKSYFHLVPRYLLTNKKRTATIAISIIFSVMLITSIGIIVNSYIAKSTELISQRSGKYQASIRNIPEIYANKLKEQPSVDGVGITLPTGFFEANSYSVNIIGSDKAAMEMFNASIIEGTYPQNKGDIALEQWVVEQMENKPRPGDRIIITYDTVNKLNAKLARQVTESFTLTGIVKNDYVSQYTKVSKAYVTLEYAKAQIPEIYRGYVEYYNLVNTSNILDALEQFEETYLNIEELGELTINNTYIASLESSAKSKIFIIYIDIIVALAAVMVIYNVFNMAIVERMRHFGLLKAIGATVRQVKLMIMVEALILAIIFVPIGIGIGSISAKLLLDIVGRFGWFNASSSISAFDIVLAFIMGFIAIAAAVYSTVRSVARISPIQSINTESRSLAHKANMNSIGSKLIVTVLGQTGKMALTNLMRNRKRFIATMISMSISIALFISVNYLVRCLDPIYQTQKFFSADYSLVFEGTKERLGYDLEVILQLEKLPGIEAIDKQKIELCGVILDKHKLTRAGLAYADKLAEHDEYQKSMNNSGKVDIAGNVYGVDTNSYKKYLSDAGSSISKIDEAFPKAIVVQQLGKEKYTDLKAGDSVVIAYVYKENNSWKKTTQEFIIEKLLEESPIEAAEGFADMEIFVNEEDFAKHLGVNGYQKIDISVDKSADTKVLEYQLSKLAQSQKNGILKSFRQQVAEIRKLQLEASLILYSMIVIIVIISLINIVNTMNMNILVRQREFGIHRAIGITKKQLKSMVIKEGFFYGLFSSVVGSSLGILLINIIYNTIKFNMEVELLIDYKVLGAAAIITVVLCLLSTLMPLRKVTALNIVESIRAVE